MSFVALISVDFCSIESNNCCKYLSIVKTNIDNPHLLRYNEISDNNYQNHHTMLMIDCQEHF